MKIEQLLDAIYYSTSIRFNIYFFYTISIKYISNLHEYHSNLMNYYACTF